MQRELYGGRGGPGAQYLSEMRMVGVYLKIKIGGFTLIGIWHKYSKHSPPHVSQLGSLCF